MPFDPDTYWFAAKEAGPLSLTAYNVGQLRKKLEADPERPEYILTETGVGYRLRAPD